MSKTFILVAPMAPDIAVACKARADAFFAECSAVHDAEVKRSLAAILAAEAANLAMAA